MKNRLTLSKSDPNDDRFQKDEGVKIMLVSRVLREVLSYFRRNVFAQTQEMLFSSAGVQKEYIDTYRDWGIVM